MANLTQGASDVAYAEELPVVGQVGVVTSPALHFAAPVRFVEDQAGGFCRGKRFSHTGSAY